MKLLVVDDSLFYRNRIADLLQDSFPEATIRKVKNGEEALKALREEKIDFVSLDLEMPILDGIETLRKIREEKITTNVVIFSALSDEGARRTLEALSVGADDFIVKPSGTSFEESLGYIKNELVSRIKALVKRHGKLNIKSTPIKTSTIHKKPDLILIGSSTGGPEALKKLFSLIKVVPKCPIILVQHMPPVFTNQLAKTLGAVAPFEVIHSDHPMRAMPGKCYLAPGDYHLKAKVIMGKDLSLYQDQSEKVCYVRPAFNVFLNGLKEYQLEKWIFVLTGMGNDGQEGSANLKGEKTKIFIQNKESSVVWGMPGSIANENLQDEILSIEEMANLINMS